MLQVTCFGEAEPLLETLPPFALSRPSPALLPTCGVDGKWPHLLCCLPNCFFPALENFPGRSWGGREGGLHGMKSVQGKTGEDASFGARPSHKLPSIPTSPPGQLEENSGELGFPSTRSGYVSHYASLADCGVALTAPLSWAGQGFLCGRPAEVAEGRPSRSRAPSPLSLPPALGSGELASFELPPVTNADFPQILHCRRGPVSKPPAASLFCASLLAERGRHSLDGLING